MKSALLVLENGASFTGRGFGANGDFLGEVVFNTAMSGYQEVFSDPSYAGQMIAMTAPEMGNTGINLQDNESARPVCAGIIVRNLCEEPSNWRSELSLSAWLTQHGIPGITGIDTRALTKMVREQGSLRGIISTTSTDKEALLRKVKSSPSMEGQELVSRVTCKEPYEWTQGSFVFPDVASDPRYAEKTPPTKHVVAYDFGLKREILCQLVDIGCRVTVVPAQTSAKDAMALRPDGYFLSNGPGDPAVVDYAISAVQELIKRSERPIFGICLGHQILGLAMGAKTFKLPFGHHGGNHPVKELATGKVEITSQNHGFAVDPKQKPKDLEWTHINLFDETVEGFRVNGKPIFCVQYHPEAGPGPHDSRYLFRQFADLMK